MSDNDKKSHNKPHEELKQMAEEIRRQVQETVRAALNSLPEELDVSLTLEVDTLTPTERSVAETSPAPVRGDDDFWDLGKPKPRVYAQPKFSSNSLSVTDVESGNSAETEKNTAQAEKILPREAYDFDSRKTQPNSGSSGSSGRVVNTVNGPRNISDTGRRVVTGSYRRNPPIKSQKSQAARKPAETVKTYRPNGILIREVSVKTWETDMEFYGRFAADAQSSHRSKPKFSIDQNLAPVPYFSYVPQYAHMSNSQVEYYRWFRECVRNGKYPPCDLPYIQLYIFEIINLPNEIAPEDGVHLLAALWLNYRKQHPRLDGYLCEWFADYCLIGGCSLPTELQPILCEIVPKAQFKEFYLGDMSHDKGNSLGQTVLEVSSDYDYRRSRYYEDNKQAYETYIPAAVTAVLKESYSQSRGIFAMDRVYRMTRDSYCGAIVSSGIKRRIDIEFCSFTRRADTRQAVTAIAKYTENKLRQVLGIKAKLGVDKIDPLDSALIDKFFEPLIPVKVKTSKEDLYMPDDYLKNYESEDSGFDFAAAQAIEAQSWFNTGRLTGDETMMEITEDSAHEYTPDEEPAIDGEMSVDTEQLDTASEPAAMAASAADEIHGITPETTENAAETPDDTAPNNENNTDEILKEALRAALVGGFRTFCRSHELYEGEIADRINNIFLDEMGDIVLEVSGGGFELIEDYREDVENWLS